MTIQLNHTIVWSRDKRESATFLADILGGEINHHDGGRGVYFPDPSGHLMEVITRPYGSGA